MQNKPVTRPAEAVRGALLQRGKETYVDPQQARSVAVLERHAPRFVQRAKKAGVTIEYLGSHPLFEESRLFNGPKTDWLLGPADSDAVEEIVPRAQLADLRRLSESGIDFPVVYVAHELPKGRVQSLVPADNALTPTMIDRTEAASLVDPAPVPRSTVELSERLSARSRQILAVLASAVPIIGAVAAAPFVVVGAALAGLATMDPIVLGVMPAGRPVPGTPATWFVLARWEW